MNETTPLGCVILPDDVDEQAKAVPLTGVDVRVQVVGPTSRVTVTQSYENREDVPVEATYLFPLEEGAAVCGFTATIDGHRLEGRVEEREEAFDEYDDAMSEGRAAFLLDQERPNLFTASVGNLLPGQTVDIELTYVAELPREGRGYRLALPQAVTPRYVPDHGGDDDRIDDEERLRGPRTHGRLGYAWNLTVDVDLLGPIGEIASPSHRIETRFDGRRATVTLAHDERRPDRDFVLKLVPQEAGSRAALVEHEGEHYAVFDVRADLPTDRHAVDVSFVVDCSGSMFGDSIRDARRTLDLFLRSLHPGDRFRVVRFGSDFERWSKGFVDYDDRSLDTASRRVEDMEADLGGTEILAPLREVLERSDRERRHRVVLITDGAVGNEDEVIDLCRRHAGHARIYAFGVGHAASEHLVRGVARVTGGAAEFVVPGERIEDKVLRHAERMARDAVEDLVIEGEGLRLDDVQPTPLPTIDPTTPATIYARVRGDGVDGAVRLRGRCGEGVWEPRLELAPAASGLDGAVVATLWARHRIRQLEDHGSWVERRGSQQEHRHRARERNRARKVEQELIELGRRFGLTSRATSYVVVDDRPDAPRAKQPADLREIAAAMPRSFGGTFDAMPVVARMSPASMGSDVVECAADMDAGLERSADLRELLRASPAARSDWADAEGWALIRHQGADGSFPVDDTVLGAIHVDRSVLDGLDADTARVAVTHLVLGALDRRDDVPASWRPALQKSREWLAQRTEAAPAGHADWPAFVAHVLDAGGEAEA